MYSQNKQYYTENEEEQLLTIGTGEGDTYLILEGHEKNKCNFRYNRYNRYTDSIYFQHTRK